MQNPNHECQRDYPKNFQQQTILTDDEFPQYARPVDPVNEHVKNNGVTVTN
jgi:hypothetical protein